MENTQYYTTLAIAMLVVAIIMLILATIMWYKLDIRHYIAVLSGTEARKGIEKIRQEAESGTVQANIYAKNNKAVISWNTSGDLNDAPKGRSFRNRNKSRNMAIGKKISQDLDATVLLKPAVPVDNDKTVLLSSSEEYATSVLNAINESAFVVEKEIVNKSTES